MINHPIITNMKPLLIFIALFFSQFACKSQGNSSTQNQITELITGLDGQIGLSIKNLRTGETLSINPKKRFPMQSVFKFPIAIAIFDQIDKGKLSLDQKVNLTKADLLPNTHSPLRDLYPDGKADITLREILSATVAQSDNNGCDYLFKMLGGPKSVDLFIKSHHIKGINIVGTEAQMHADEKVQYANYCLPSAMTQLFEQFYTGKLLSKKSTEELWNILVSTTTATNRIKAGLPPGTVFGHKSGWSGGDDRGFTNAINDAGIFIMPKGTPVAISVFISDTHMKSTETDKLTAQITKLVYDYYNSQIH